MPNPTPNHHTVPCPAGARHVGPWGLEGTARSFVGTMRDVPAKRRNVSVDIGGFQLSDGRIGRYITVVAPLPMLSPADARRLALALIAAADEVEWLSDVDGNVES